MLPWWQEYTHIQESPLDTDSRLHIHIFRKILSPQKLVQQTFPSCEEHEHKDKAT